MIPRPRRFSQAVAVCVGFMLGGMPAHGLLRWNEGKDQIFVTASVSATADSNIFTSSIEESDFIWNATLGAEYRRHAGLIGVNATVSTARSEFKNNPDEGFTNPNMRLEFTKDAGRTTGTLSFSALRSTRADPSVNIRTDSWNYNSQLNFRYPISERHSLSGGVSWGRIDYLDNTVFVDLDTSSMSLDWFYVLSTQRDIFGGYRLRYLQSSADTTFADHSISAGVSGRLLPGLNGTARFGYQLREAVKGSGENYSGWNAAVTSTWNFTRKLALSGALSKDYSVTSTNVSTDTLSGNLDLQYARSAKLVFAVGTGAGHIKFLGLEGDNREDTFVTAYGRIGYTFSERLRVSLLYSYYRNWSTLAFSDFDRHSITFNASTRF